jgi:hypothetical protein
MGYAQIKRNPIKVKTKLGCLTKTIKMGKTKKQDERYKELRAMILSLQILKYFLSL